MVASLLATHLNFDRDRATSIVGLSAMLHDVGMIHIAKELHNVDPADLTCEDLDIYEAHPTIGQEMLKQIHGIEPVVIQAVGQHHERRSGKGFPNKLRSGSINVVAEIIGISEEFIKLLIRAQKDPSIHVMKKMERRLDGFSHSTATSFRFFFGKCP
jgi:HD-GYP domain-containing protein (c-di-GMP phosphodiesterase class II)